MPIRENPAPDGHAETVALQALGWIAADEDRLGRFMGLAGLTADELRARAGEAEFLGGVLDFVLGDEATTLAFATEAGLKPDALMRLRRKLPGAPVWE